MEFKPPPQPWITGKHGGYTTFLLEVGVSQDETNRVWSFHDFQTSEDQVVSMTLPHGGTQQVAYALLTEAYRRECFVTALAEMSENSDFLDEYRKAGSKEKEVLERGLSTAAQEVMRRTLAKMGTGVPREILGMLLDVR